MTDGQAADILRMLGKMQGLLESHTESCLKRANGFDRDIENLWHHSGKSRERIVVNEQEVKNLSREVFKRGTAAGATAGGTAGVIIAVIYFLLQFAGVI